MKFVRFYYEGTTAYGVVEGEEIWELRRAPYAGLETTGRKIPFSWAKLLPPAEPEKIVGVGLNYMDHITSQGLSVPEEPYIVHRPRNTLNSHLGKVAIRREHAAQFEGELVIVMGKTCRNVAEKDADAYIFGYTIGNDITEKDFFRRDRHFGVAKAFDTQCPIGPWIVTNYDCTRKRIRTTVNGVVRQDGSTASMVFSCRQLVSYLSGFMTLEPGDLILTGSPAGVGPLAAGDTVEVFVEGIGSLVNEIRDREK